METKPVAPPIAEPAAPEAPAAPVKPEAAPVKPEAAPAASAAPLKPVEKTDPKKVSNISKLALNTNNVLSKINVQKSWRSNILGIIIFLWIIVCSVADVVNRNEQGAGNNMVAMHLIFAYASMPFLLEVYPFLINWKWQALAAFAVLVLDWVSLREDKSRFSERPGYFLMSAVDPKITGRQNAALTGIAAHLADVLGLLLIFMPVVGFTWKMFFIILIPAIIYSVVGSSYIINLTKDGSQSDVRELTETVQEIESLSKEGGNEDDIAKLKIDAYDSILSSKRSVQLPNIWPDYERQMINLVITYLGALMSWQAIFSSYGTWDGEGRLTKIERAYFGITRKDVPEECKVDNVDLSKNSNCQPWWEGNYSSVTNLVFINCFTHMFYAFIGPLVPFWSGEIQEDKPSSPECMINESKKFKWTTVVGITVALSTFLELSGVNNTGLSFSMIFSLIFAIVLVVYIIYANWGRGLKCWLDRFWKSLYMISRFMLPFVGIIMNIFMTVLPNYNNWINTGYQAASPAGELFLHDVPILSNAVGKEILNDDNKKKLKEYNNKIRKSAKVTLDKLNE